MRVVEETNQSLSSPASPDDEPKRGGLTLTFGVGLVMSRVKIISKKEKGEK